MTASLATAAALAAPMLHAPAAQAQTNDLIECSGRIVRSLEFVGPQLISGAANQVSSVYRYNNVGDGVDARVTILQAFNGGGIAQIDDDNVNGLPNNFQPAFALNGTSAVRFQIEFFVGGTNLTTQIPVDFAASAIDIDGGAGILEFAEFENGFVESIIDANTDLIESPGIADPVGFTRWRASTQAAQPGISETAAENIVTVFYTDVTSIRYTIGAFTGAGAATTPRLTSLGFNCPLFGSPITDSEIDEDFADAPASFGNPVHTLVDGIRLGATNTADAGPFDSATATGDTGDDGVTFGGAFAQNETTAVTVDVAGANGRLQAWFDWNADGDFDEPGEQVATDVQDTDNDGTITLNVAVPLTAVATTTFARFRWSTSAGLETNTAAGDGEVEDYQIGPIAEASADLDAVKTVEVFDPGGLGLFMTPGNEVLYRITVTNPDTSSAAANDIDLSDTLPDNLQYVTATVTGFTGGSITSTLAANTDCDGGACVVTFEDGTLGVDETGELSIRALIK